MKSPFSGWGRMIPVWLAWMTVAANARAGTSVYTAKPDDPKAVDVVAPAFAVKGDGVADDTDALQAAINRVQETTRRGLVFLPAGRYRLTHELQLWSGIRLIGYGATRPVLVLGAHTPGYDSGTGKYLVHFVSDRPMGPNQPVRDANPGTFYSALSNVDLEIQDGNPAAVGVRSHYAQHCFLAHIDFQTGSGRAGVEDAGNLSEDLHFFGGDYGISTAKPSPSWPFVLVDSSFEGQRRAAVDTEECGLTLIRTHIRNVPTAIAVRENRCEELWLEDSRLEHITGPALIVSEERSARTQINLRNVVCVNVPHFAAFRESGRQLDGAGAIYRVKEFSHGLQIPELGATPQVQTVNQTEILASVPALVPTTIAALPPVSEWVNVRTLGARGDGSADDTAALRAAIAAHRVLYFPSGFYRVTDTLALQPDTVLIGLNPTTTRIMLADFTAAFQGVHGPAERPVVPDIPGLPRAWRVPPAFAGSGAPKAMVETPAGGSNIITGLGLDTNGINNRAVALKWRSGARSLVNDVRFLGGHGTYDADGQWLPIYNDNRTGDSDSQRRWDSQHWSLWVTEGGGGTFMDIWTPSTFAAAGLYVSDTDTPGQVYALSSEHHVRNEVKLKRVSNWKIYGLQTEEESGESPQALPLEIDGCRHLTIANFFIYRVDIPAAFPTGILVTASHDLDFRGLHVYSPGKLSFDNTLIDQTHGVQVRSREIAWLHLSGAAPAAAAAAPSPVLATGAKVERVTGGFANIEGMVADPKGAVYFVDQHAGRIHRWSRAEGVSLVTDAVPQPVALALDRAGNLVVVSHHGNVYALKPGESEQSLAVLEPAPAHAGARATAWVPVSRWRDSHDWLAVTTRTEPFHYLSPDGSVSIPAPEFFTLLPKPGRTRGAGTVDLVRTYALTPAPAGTPVYLSDEFGQTTWRFLPGPDGTLGTPFRFAEEGEAGTAVDADGNVYVCAGQVFVYSRTGEPLGTIDVPERPSALAFGDDGQTLYIAARTSLYAVRTKAAGR